MVVPSGRCHAINVECALQPYLTESVYKVVSRKSISSQMFFRLVIIHNKLTYLWGNWLLQNDWIVRWNPKQVSEYGHEGYDGAVRKSTPAQNRQLNSWISHRKQSFDKCVGQLIFRETVLHQWLSLGDNLRLRHTIGLGARERGLRRRSAGRDFRVGILRWRPRGYHGREARRSFFFFITLEPRVEWHKRLCALNTSPSRNRCTFLPLSDSVWDLRVGLLRWRPAGTLAGKLAGPPLPSSVSDIFSTDLTLARPFLTAYDPGWRFRIQNAPHPWPIVCNLIRENNFICHSLETNSTRNMLFDSIIQEFV